MHEAKIVISCPFSLKMGSFSYLQLQERSTVQLGSIKQKIYIPQAKNVDFCSMPSNCLSSTVLGY